jgi:uncharacterized membrane protein
MRELAIELERPQIQLSFFSALQTRLGRVYGPLLAVLIVTWFVKLSSHPQPASSFAQFIERAHIGPTPLAKAKVAHDHRRRLTHDVTQNRQVGEHA